ncbi:hypothetical protein C1S82_10425 [Mycolicibacterium cosmeticum]|uniref:PE-PGRS family protein n=1 Tax=Mycolicibacterium cosmeticum TaxID=258533 RepID=W9AU26_MYCCO|nr:hypothetical protein [Mycolicibacterium cosmeticum]TLH74956.1 hypothetical protein C1S82_10425 [Mycolicibacterium cosmeticum]CDO09314.1 hypothetical protein BN977_04135 [Mycolicibacterium cosmeticum]
MQIALRPYATAGVTLVAAGAIAMSPVLPVTKIEVAVHQASSAAVALAASPFDVYGQVLQDTIANVRSVGQTAFANGPFPLLQKILENQAANLGALGSAVGASGGALLKSVMTDVPTLLRQSLTELGQGNVEASLNSLINVVLTPLLAGVNPLTGALLPALQHAIADPLQNLANVANQLPNIGLELGLAVLGPTLGGLGAVGAAVQGVVDAVRTGNLGKVLTAVVQAPAVMVNGLLNGGYGPNVGGLIGLEGINVVAGGLFNPGGFADNTLTLPGLVASLVNVRDTIVNALTASAKTPTTAPTTAVSSTALPTAASTVTLRVKAPTAESATAPAPATAPKTDAGNPTAPTAPTAPSKQTTKDTDSSSTKDTGTKGATDTGTKTGRTGSATKDTGSATKDTGATSTSGGTGSAAASGSSGPAESTKSTASSGTAHNDGAGTAKKEAKHAKAA